MVKQNYGEEKMPRSDEARKFKLKRDKG